MSGMMVSRSLPAPHCSARPAGLVFGVSGLGSEGWGSGLGAWSLSSGFEILGVVQVS